MASTFYDIEISAIAGAAPSDGFIDPVTVELYLNQSTVLTDYAGAVEKKRANRRFTYLINQLQLLGNAYITDIEVPGADVDTPPTKISFRVEFEHGDATLRTPNEDDDGNFVDGVILEGVDAVKRAVARALKIAETGLVADVYDPTPARENSINVRGMQLDVIDIGALTEKLTDAEAAITVTKLV